jgi:hypothetical protein
MEEMPQSDMPESEHMPPHFIANTGGNEIRMPRTFRVLLNAIMGSCVLVLFVGGASWLAIHNLWTDRSLVSVVPSSLWLMVVAVFVFAGISGAQGVRRAAVCILGVFSLDHFVDINGDEAPDQLFGHGFRCFGRPFYFDKVPLSRVTLVEWSMGQASSHAGRDMDDWSVSVWYKPTPPHRPRYPFGRRPEEDLFILGLWGPKARIAAFGKCVANLMIAAGLPLVQSEDDCSFVSCDSRDEEPSNKPDAGDA